MAKKFSDLFAFDLDGTLVHDLPGGQRGISDSLSEIIHKISEQAHIVVATGRRYRAALRDLGSLPSMPFAVLHNGLVIKDSKGKTVHSKYIPALEVYEIAKMLKEHEVDFFIAADGYEVGVDFIFVKSALEKSQDLKNVFQRTFGFNRIIDSLEGIRDFNEAPYLELVSVSDYKRLVDLKKIVEKYLPLSFRALLVKNIGLPGIGALEIFPKETSKWTGVNFVRERLGAGRVIAVGDDENDIEMIKSAHIGLVMDHAEPHVQAASHRHIAGPGALTDFLREFYK